MINFRDDFSISPIPHTTNTLATTGGGSEVQKNNKNIHKVLIMCFLKFLGVKD